MPYVEMSQEERTKLIDEAIVRNFGQQGEQEPEEITDPRTQIVECLKTQRLFLEGAKERAKQFLGSMPGYFPNPYDFETQVEIRYCLEVAMAFVNTVFPGIRPNTVEECAERMVKAESGNKSKDKMIDYLRDELGEAGQRIDQLKGGQK